MPNRPADVELLVSCANRLASALGVAPRPDALIRQVTERVLEERQTIERVTACILTREEAIDLLFAHWDSAVFGMPEVPNRATAWNEPTLRRDVGHGIFGEPTFAQPEEISCTGEWAELLAVWDASPALEDRRRVFEAASTLARKGLSVFWDWFLGLSADERANGSLARAVIASFRGAVPVPRRAYLPMLRAAVEERDPSFNRVFIEPCVRAYGGTSVAEVLLELLRAGSASDKAGAAAALYWVSKLGARDLDAHRPEMRRVMLHEFVHCGDLNVRRSLLGQLSLAAGDYRAEDHSMIEKAIAIARESDDEYLQHRIETQLGSGGPPKPLPTRS